MICKNELVYEYEQILASINTYDEFENNSRESKIYEDLILVNRSSNSAGMTCWLWFRNLRKIQKN